MSRGQGKASKAVQHKLSVGWSSTMEGGREGKASQPPSAPLYCWLTFRTKGEKINAFCEATSVGRSVGRQPAPAIHGPGGLRKATEKWRLVLCKVRFFPPTYSDIFLRGLLPAAMSWDCCMAGASNHLPFRKLRRRRLLLAGRSLNLHLRIRPSERVSFLRVPFSFFPRYQLARSLAPGAS